MAFVSKPKHTRCTVLSQHATESLIQRNVKFEQIDSLKIHTVPTCILTKKKKSKVSCVTAATVCQHDMLDALFCWLSFNALPIPCLSLCYNHLFISADDLSSVNMGLTAIFDAIKEAGKKAMVWCSSLFVILEQDCFSV